MRRERGAEKFINGRMIRWAMIILAVMLNIKYIFVDFGIDAGFQITMSYRAAMGCAMFKEMWEPHQLSSFLCAFFIKIYLMIFHTNTGLVIFLQTIGVLLDGFCSYVLYVVLDKCLNRRNTAFAMAWVFFVVSPKDVPIPEYANMQLWFSLLFCLTFFLYDQRKKRIWLIISALCLCGEILAYPSCIILIFGIVFCLFIGRINKKEFGIFMGTCILGGVFCLVAIFRHITVSEFISCVKNMLALETAHSAGIGEKIIAYLKQAGMIICLFAGGT